MYCRIIARITDPSHLNSLSGLFSPCKHQKFSRSCHISTSPHENLQYHLFLCVCMPMPLPYMFLPVSTCQSCHSDPARCYFIFLFLGLRALLKAHTKWFQTLLRFHESIVDISMILFVHLPQFYQYSLTTHILSLYSCLSLSNLGSTVSVLKMVVRVLFTPSVPVWPFIYNLFYSHSSLLIPFAFVVCVFNLYHREPVLPGSKHL